MRLLLVEDDPVLSQTLSKGLRERAYAVDVAATGDEALYLSAINPYDVIILDVMLPGGDGFAVCEEIRRRSSQARVLMLTARDDLRDRIRGLDTGADDYVTKPFDFEELLARIRALLRRSGEVMPDELRVGDLVLDTRMQTAVRGGQPIPLTTKEYALLEYLVRNAGRVVGRAEISAHVWDDNYDPASNLIEVYVNRLRRKVDEGAEPLLHTRRGAGYLLASPQKTVAEEPR
jgi:two-component system copper resistance phosphate regulon response regulator CusR